MLVKIVSYVWDSAVRLVLRIIPYKVGAFYPHTEIWNFRHRRDIKKAESEGSADVNFMWGEYFQIRTFDSLRLYSRHPRSKHGSAAMGYWKKALLYFTLSLKSGNTEAARRLGNLFDLNNDSPEAFKIFLSGAESGDPYCQVCVADMYLTGDGGLQSEHLAFEWILKAINWGDTVDASKEQKREIRSRDEFICPYFQLSKFYLEGRVVERNIAEAYFWVSIALSLLKRCLAFRHGGEHTSPRAVSARYFRNTVGSLLCYFDIVREKNLLDLGQEWTQCKAELAAKMRPDEVAAAERRAVEWLSGCDYA